MAKDSTDKINPAKIGRSLKGYVGTTNYIVIPIENRRGITIQLGETITLHRTARNEAGIKTNSAELEQVFAPLPVADIDQRTKSAVLVIAGTDCNRSDHVGPGQNFRDEDVSGTHDPRDAPAPIALPISQISFRPSV